VRSRNRLLRLSLTLLVALVVVGPGTPARAATPPLPDTMASMGDSITRGFNACGWFVDCPSRSWSTGSSTSVNSHYLRLRALTPAIADRNYTAASTGAKMSALYGQVGTAVSKHADYVTILLGANDACASTESTMTSVATFEKQLRSGLSRLKSGRPDAAVLIASIPDLKRLWEIGRTSSSARSAWSAFGICQSMLARPTSTQQADVDRRSRVRQRVVDYNAALARACTDYGARCRFDGNAVFSYPFVLSQVSAWDYFHPNTAGQRALAGVTYAAGFGW
jgi:lysophospholipase L1-like esterase